MSPISQEVREILERSEDVSRRSTLVILSTKEAVEDTDSTESLGLLSLLSCSPVVLNGLYLLQIFQSLLVQLLQSSHSPLFSFFKCFLSLKKFLFNICSLFLPLSESFLNFDESQVLQPSTFIKLSLSQLLLLQQFSDFIFHSSLFLQLFLLLYSNSFFLFSLLLPQ